MTYTTADLINAVKIAETIPDSGAAYSDEDLLQYLNFALNGIVQAMQVVNEEYFVVTKDFPLTSQMVNFNGMPQNVDNVINIPPEASGMRLRDVYMVGFNGVFTNLPRLTPTQAASQAFSWFGTNTSNSFANTNGMAGFYLQGNQIQIFPYTLAQQNTFRITFQKRPADLCLVGDAAQVISVVGDTIQINNVPSWTPMLTRLNAISGFQPHEYVIDATQPTDVYCTPNYIENFVLQGIAGNVITLPAGIAVNIQPGDWICPQGQSVFAQNIPQEFYPALVQKAAEMCLEAAGDRDGQQTAMKSYTDMMRMNVTNIAPRVIGKPVRAIPINSAFRASRKRFWVS